MPIQWDAEMPDAPMVDVDAPVPVPPQALWAFVLVGLAGLTALVMLGAGFFWMFGWLVAGGGI